MQPHPSGKGFSLVELLIAVAVILLIAAITIPNLVRSRIAAHHAAAVSNLRAINAAQMTYSLQYGLGYASTLATLGPPEADRQPSAASADLIDNSLTSGTKSGYIFTYTPGAADALGHYQQYAVNADPSVVGRTGINYYFTDESAVIRMNLDTTASVSDPPLDSGTYASSAGGAGAGSASTGSPDAPSTSAVTLGTSSGLADNGNDSGSNTEASADAAGDSDGRLAQRHHDRRGASGGHGRRRPHRNSATHGPEE